MDIAAGSVTSGAGNMLLSGIENVRGSTSDDLILGDGNDNSLDGGGGNDTLMGGLGADTYVQSHVADFGTTSISDTGGIDALILGPPGDFSEPIDYIYSTSGDNLIITHNFSGNFAGSTVVTGYFTTAGLMERFIFSELPIVAYSSATAGNAGNNFLITNTGTALNVDGGAGKDVIIGGAQNDTLTGGTDNDHLLGGDGNDVLSGGTGNDSLNGEAGNDRLDGGTGDDFYLLDERNGKAVGDDTIADSAGLDEIELGHGVVVVGGGRAGDDLVIELDGGSITIENQFAGAPIEVLEASQFGNTINDDDFFIIRNDLTGTIAPDLLAGTVLDETIQGDDGGDLIMGFDGADTLIGGLGNDTLIGGGGADKLDGGSGNDSYLFSPLTDLDIVVDGSGGSDVLRLVGESVDPLSLFMTVRGSDMLVFDQSALLFGGIANASMMMFDEQDTTPSVDLLLFESGGDLGARFVFSATGNDDWAVDATALAGGAGNDVIYGSQLGANISGDAGDDFLITGIGNDTLAGGAGSDSLFGGDGLDDLQGGADNDVLIGGDGNDVLDGGTGDDLYIMTHASDAVLFDGSGNDTLRFTEGSGVPVSIFDVGNSVSVILEDGNSVQRFMTLTDQNIGLGVTNVELPNFAGGSNIMVFQTGLTGTGGPDLLTGTGAAELITGGAGNDALYGSGGSDTLQGGDGDDLINPSDGNDTLDGGAGTDTADFWSPTTAVTVNLTTGSAIQGGFAKILTGIENILGTPFDDSLTGDAGNNLLDGRDGDDFLAGGGGNDTYLFHRLDGSGQVLITDSGGAADVLKLGSPNNPRLPTDFDFERSGFDLIIGDLETDVAGQHVVIQGHLSAGSRIERFVFDLGVDLSFTVQSAGTGGNDFIFNTNNAAGAGGDDLLVGGGGSEALFGGDGNDHLLGSAGNDTLNGDDGNDILYGGEGDDTLKGGAGDDTYVFRHEAGDAVQFEDIIDTGGTDRLMIDNGLFPGLAHRIGDDLNLRLFPSADTAGGQSLTIENQFASQAVEFLVSGASKSLAEPIAIAAGFIGTDASDLVAGTTTDDTLTGGKGNDLLFGGNGNDDLSGGLDDDILTGGIGDDILSGGAGRDTASFIGAGAAVTVDLSAGTASGEGSDILSGIEDVIGSGLDDLILGNAGDNIITGGGGLDSMTGGGGSDVFVYNDPAEGEIIATDVVASPGGDTITDFGNGADRIQFNGHAFGITSVTFFSLAAYDGTNAGVSPGSGHFVFDTTQQTLYFDDDSSDPGYTALATTPGSAVVATDIDLITTA